MQNDIETDSHVSLLRSAVASQDFERWLRLFAAACGRWIGLQGYRTSPWNCLPLP
jgi:hypothetical protein